MSTNCTRLPRNYYQIRTYSPSCILSEMGLRIIQQVKGQAYRQINTPNSCRKYPATCPRGCPIYGVPRKAATSAIPLKTYREVDRFSIIQAHEIRVSVGELRNIFGVRCTCDVRLKQMGLVTNPEN